MVTAVAPDFPPAYVRARTALLDALEALGAQRGAVVVIGAQAVYLREGLASRTVPALRWGARTADADIMLDPRALADKPLLGDMLKGSGIAATPSPGAWLSSDDVAIDLLVPEALAGPGRRAARLGVHGKTVARRARGLEAVLVDYGELEVSALGAGDGRRITANVAGEAALIVAKMHKIGERLATGDRVRDKDALDVLRLLTMRPRADLARALTRLAGDDVSSDATNVALRYLHAHFGHRSAEGYAMARRALAPDGLTADQQAAFSATVGALPGATVQRPLGPPLG